MTAAQAAQQLNVSRQRISQLIQTGKLEVKNNEITKKSVDVFKKTRKNGRPLGSFTVTKKKEDKNK